MKKNCTTEPLCFPILTIRNLTGALLLALLLASPWRASAQTISSDSTTGVDLNDFFNPPINSVTIISTIDNSTSGTDAVVGSGRAWNVTNDGQLNGADNGLHLTAGGSLDNQINIFGGNNGVTITNGTGSVINEEEAQIGGTTNNGVQLDSGGTVINNFLGTISGGTNGVLIRGGVGFVQNSFEATITGANGNGVELDAGGGVDNEQGNILGNRNGVLITGTTGFVTNFAGTIDGGNHEGVELNDGGTVVNLEGAINGNNNGVEVNNFTGLVINDGGQIYGTNNNGVLLNEGGSVVQTNGTIIGHHDGVQVNNASGSVENHGGLISGLNGDGVHMNEGGTVDNENQFDDGGQILGSRDGVQISGEFGTVANTNSTITGTSRNGVTLNVGGTVINNGISALVSGGQDGVHISGGFGTVDNYDGHIVGTGNNGVQMDNGGFVDNEFGFESTGGVITGASNGVDIAGSGGQVNNEGTIIGTNHDGVFLEAGGTVNNFQGTIWGGQYGVEITGGPAPVGIIIDDNGGHVLNEGTITGYTRDGVRLRSGGTVNNDGGFIFGNENGVHVSGGSGDVQNGGTIIGTNRDGVRLEGSGTVENFGGSITGGQYGVEISGTAPVKLGGGGGGGGGSIIVNADVFNDDGGTITGQGRDGVRERNGGSVENEGGTITGNDHGVHITGGSGTVFNSGTIGGGEDSIVLDDFNNTVTLGTGSQLNGDVVGGSATDTLILQGQGSEDNNFLNFENLVVQGDGAPGWNLIGTNTFSVGTVVSNGLLRVNGQLTTPLLSVNPEGALGGSGVIFGTVDNEGDLMPGNSPGTLTIIGDYTNGGTYHVQVDGKGPNDNVLISGQATIASGEVSIEPEHGLFGPQTTISILTASNGISGTFTNVVMNRLFLTNEGLQYIGDTGPLPTNIQVTLDRISFKSVARTFNERAVAGALDKIIDPVIAGNDPGMSNVVDSEFAINDPHLANVTFDSMSGEIHGTAGMLDGQQQDMFNHSIALRTGRLSTGDAQGGYAETKPVYLATAGSSLPPVHAEAQKPWDLWFQGIGGFGNLDGDGNAQGGNFTISGFSGGIDYRVNQGLLIGLSVGYTHDDINAGVDNSSAKVDAIQFGGYASYVSGPWHFDGIISYGMLSTDTKRIAFADESFESMPKASYDGGIVSLSAEGGYDFTLSKHITLQPSLGIIYNHLDQDSFKEKNGGPLGLDVKSVTMDSFRSDLGVKLMGNWGKPEGVRFQPQLRAGWQHEFADRTASVDEQFLFDATDTSFKVRGVQLGTESFNLGAGVTVPFNRTVSAFVNYDAHLNDQLTSQNVSGGISIAW